MPASDEGRRNREIGPGPSAFAPSLNVRVLGTPGLRRKPGHTSFSPSTLEPPKPSGSASHPSDEDLSLGTPASSGPICARNAATSVV